MPGGKRAPRSKKRATKAAGDGHPRKLPKTTAERAAIARLRAICLALPDATEKIAWGELTWRAGTWRVGTWRVGKIFAQMDTHHHGADHVAVWLPARAGLQEALVEEDPVTFFRPPYVGPKGWIGVRIDRRPDWRVVEGLVADAYRQVASPGLVKRLDAAQHDKKRGWHATWIGAVVDEDELA